MLPAILTLKQAAEYLQLNPDELERALEQNQIPGGQKVIGKWRIRRESLDSFLDNPQLVEQSEALSKEVAPSAAPRIVKQPSTSPEKDNLAVSKTVEQTPKPKVSPSPENISQASKLPSKVSNLVQGEVINYNSKQRFGYARLADGSVVWIDSQHLATGSYTPRLGDKIIFEIKHTRKGKQARNVRQIKNDLSSTAEVLTRDSKTTPKAKVPSPRQETAITPRSPDTSPKPKSKPTLLTPPKQKPPLKGTNKAWKLYQKAAVARAEGRFGDARRLFRQAIEAGAGTTMYEAFVKMLNEKGYKQEARQVIQQAIETFPRHVNFYNMYGHMERRSRNYQLAEEIFREGLKILPHRRDLQMGLAQVLVQVGAKDSLKEAGEIFESLKQKGKLQIRDGLYQRFKAFQQNPRANRVYEFFRVCQMKPGITGSSELPEGVIDIIVDIQVLGLDEPFGLSNAVLVRCFRSNPRQADLGQLQEYLQSFGPRDTLGVQDGRQFVLNKSLAFITVANGDLVRDHVMSILSERGEAIVPLDDAQLKNLSNPVQVLREVLGQYLGLRDLYSSTFPVSGRRFFGREKLLLKLADQIRAGQFLGIYGLRKVGKTSLLYQLLDEKLREEAVAYVDLQDPLSLPEVYWAIERDLYQRLHKKHSQVADFLHLGKIARFSELPETYKPALFFKEDIQVLLEAILEGKVQPIKKLVIVLDELERILPVAGQPGVEGYLEFFRLLRGLAQTERYRNLISSVVAAANAAISERGYWEGRENPVFALYKSIFLPPFTGEECDEMITTLGKGMSVYWEEDALATIFTETGGHPFLARSFCSRIVKQYPTPRPIDVTVEMVQEQIIPFIRAESDKFEQITELLRTHFPEEEKLLEQIALDEAPSDIPDDALRHLSGYRLIQLEGENYKITLNLLRRWLRRRAGVRD